MNTTKNRFPIAAIFFAALTLSILFNLFNSFKTVLYETSYYISQGLSIILHLTITVQLFRRKCDLLLATGIGVLALLQVYYLFMDILRVIQFPGSLRIDDFIMDLFYIIIWVVPALIVVTSAIAALSKYSNVVKKLWFLPGVLIIIGNIIWFFKFSNGDVIKHIFYSFSQQIEYLLGWQKYPPIYDIITIMLEVLAIFTLCYWLKSPEKKVVSKTPSANGSTSSPVSAEEAEIYCSLGKHILLLLFTCGIWMYIWIWRVTKYLNRTPNAEQYNPTTKLLLCMFIPFYQIFWLYKHGQRLDTLSAYKKLNGSEMATLCLLLGIFFPIVAFILMQDKLNTLCTAKEMEPTPTTVSLQTPSASQELNNLDTLKKYKELLDMGILTPEEFEAKKKKLLNL